MNTSTNIAGGYAYRPSEISANNMNATVDDDILNNEWERILHEVDAVDHRYTHSCLL